LISELQMLGVINTRVVSRGRYGRTKEMSFGPGTGGIKSTILEDENFDEERLSRINMSRFRTPF
ncbi:MAG: cell division control protein Cdc6, partial [Methanomicrobium sp.]|nr:cell division control protein Cdc6 [Methanomicrobium sp.]